MHIAHCTAGLTAGSNARHLTNQILQQNYMCALYRGCGFDSRSGRYQVGSTWLDGTGKPSCYITNTKVNSVFRPSGVGKSRIGLFGRGQGRARSPVLSK